MVNFVLAFSRQMKKSHRDAQKTMNLFGHFRHKQHGNHLLDVSTALCDKIQVWQNQYSGI